RRADLLVPHPKRHPVRARRGRLPVPAQYHHGVHVHRADAERRQPELCDLLLPAQGGLRPSLHVLRDGGGGGRSGGGPGDYPDGVQGPFHPEYRRCQFDERLATEPMQLWLIPIFPLAGFLINGILGRRFPKSLVNAVAIGSVVLSFLWVLKTVLAMGDLNTAHLEHYFTWIQSGV